MLAPLFGGRAARHHRGEHPGARPRRAADGVSNKLGRMVLTTGNKSEMAVGYATLYGDMCGGYSVLKDVYKTRCSSSPAGATPTCPRGSSDRPAGHPERIITKPPTAELRPDQKDEDSLPPYEELDPILKGLVEHDLRAAEIVARGLSRRHGPPRLEHARPRRVQAAPGAARREDHRRSFGRDRRYPITNAFRRAGNAELERIGPTPPSG